MCFDRFDFPSDFYRVTHNHRSDHNHQHFRPRLCLPPLPLLLLGLLHLLHDHDVGFHLHNEPHRHGDLHHSTLPRDALHLCSHVRMRC